MTIGACNERVVRHISSIKYRLSSRFFRSTFRFRISFSPKSRPRVLKHNGKPCTCRHRDRRRVAAAVAQRWNVFTAESRNTRTKLPERVESPDFVYRPCCATSVR
jgi:hypothetical protein